MTNDFLYPTDSKIYRKEPSYTKAPYREHIFAIPLAIRYIEVPLYILHPNILKTL